MTSLTFVGHATVLLEIEGVRILTDPVLRRRLLFLRRVAPGPSLSSARYAEVDAVVLSHLHHDHCDLPSLALLDPAARPIVTPAGGEELMRRHGFAPVIALRPGESHVMGPVTLTATRAAHDGMRRPFGPRAAAVGYLITTADTAVYFAGDTGLFDEMDGLCPRLDLALVPVWGWGPNLGPGHLDPAGAAEAVARLRPRRAVPVHWGTLFPYGLERIFRDRLDRPGEDFAEAVRARGLPTEVLILRPGGELTWRP